MEISCLENFHVDIGNLRGRGEVRYFVIRAPLGHSIGQQVVGKYSVNMSVEYQSTGQPTIS